MTALSPDILRAAFADLPRVEADDLIARGKPVAQRLSAIIDAVREESKIAEVASWAFNVEIVLKNGDQWAIECLSPEAFRMYPAGANSWVRKTDMDVDELVRDINDVAFRTSKEELQNA
jgi:hypothetical protein